MSETGQAAEALAADHLARRGIKVLQRNYRCRGGEIDLICDDRGTLVFVEVRMRSNARFGGAAASVTAAKRRRIVLAARHFLAGKPQPPCRFDVIALDRLDPAAVSWIRDAFAAD